MNNISEATEQELREMEVPWPKSEEELLNYIRSLVQREHDYGTCVYAMSMSALATFNYVSNQLGVTGFQAGCADMDFLRRSRRMENGFQILDYKNLLYPQYLTEEHFPSIETLMMKQRKNLREAAKKLLEENAHNFVHIDVKNHWQKLASEEE